MCKLNIYCTAEDGLCNCHKLAGIPAPNQKVQNNLLSSIITFISTQPEVLAAISDGKIDPALIQSIQSPLDPPYEPAPPKSETTELHISLLNDLPDKIFVGRPFSLMVEIVDKHLTQVKFDDPIRLQVALSSRADENKEILLGEIETCGVGLFKKIEVPERVLNYSLTVKALGRPDIGMLRNKVKICVKKKVAGKPEESKTE